MSSVTIKEWSPIQSCVLVTAVLVLFHLPGFHPNAKPVAAADCFFLVVWRWGWSTHWWGSVPGVTPNQVPLPAEEETSREGWRRCKDRDAILEPERSHHHGNEWRPCFASCMKNSSQIKAQKYFFRKKAWKWKYCFVHSDWYVTNVLESEETVAGNSKQRDIFCKSILFYHKCKDGWMDVSSSTLGLAFSALMVVGPHRRRITVLRFGKIQSHSTVLGLRRPLMWPSLRGNVRTEARARRQGRARQWASKRQYGYIKRQKCPPNNHK